MRGTPGGWVAAIALGVVLGAGTASAQEAGSITGSPGPGVPYLLETVLPVPSIRLQTHFMPLSMEAGGQSTDNFLVPFRLHGVWFFSESVVGEASLPFLLSFPSEGDSGFDLGNPRLGMEFPIVSEDGQKHRLSLSVDLYLPFAQIPLGDRSDVQLQLDHAVRRDRYGLAATALPALYPDYSVETFTPQLGTHYRFRQGKLTTHVSLTLPIFMGFDFNQDIFFHQIWAGLRYGIEGAYEVRPIFPTLEVVGVTIFGHDDPSTPPGATALEVETTTALLTTLGIRGAFAQHEPGIAVTYPITLGGDNDDRIDRSVYIHFDYAYRFE